MSRAFALGLMILGAPHVSPRSATAQDLPSAAILATATGRGVDSSLGDSFERVLRSRIHALGVIEARGSVALNLADVQMALSCDGGTRTCLVAVAHELAVRYLVISNLDRIGDELVLSVALFDSEGGGAPHRVDRRSAEESGLLDQVDGLLDELFDVAANDGAGGQAAGDHAPPEPASSPAPAAPAPPPAPSSSNGPDGGRLGAALAVGLGGLVGVGLGIGFGVASQDSANQYAAAEAIADEAEANRRLAAYRDAADQATLANVFYVAGGAVLTGALVWATIELASPGGTADEGASLVPWVSPRSGGLAIIGELP